MPEMKEGLITEEEIDVSVGTQVNYNKGRDLSRSASAGASPTTRPPAQCTRP